MLRPSPVAPLGSRDFAAPCKRTRPPTDASRRQLLLAAGSAQRPPLTGSGPLCVDPVGLLCRLSFATRGFRLRFRLSVGFSNRSCPWPDSGFVVETHLSRSTSSPHQYQQLVFLDDDKPTRSTRFAVHQHARDLTI